MPDPDLTARLIQAIPVLTKENVQTGSGHLSARLPGGDTFLINPRYAGALAEPEDICTVNLDAKRLEGSGPIPIETVIHSVIYRRRPDVGAAFHSHPRYGILLGLLDIGYVAFTRESGLFADGVPVFPSSKGINTVEMADKLADTLGDHYAVFLKGHGVVVVGPNVEATAVASIQFENACYNQLFMMQFTKPEPLGDMSHGLSGARMENPYRAWPFLLLKHGLRPKEEIRAMAIAGSRETLREAAE